MTIRRQVKRLVVGGTAERETRRAVLALALPLVGSDLLQRGVNVVDALLVGRLGAAEVAAVGLSQLLLMFVMALVYGLGVGATVMVAFHTGATDSRRRALAARTVLLIGVAATLVLGCSGILFSSPVARFMGADGRRLDLTLDYGDGTLAGTSVLTLENLDTVPVARIPLQLGRLLYVALTLGALTLGALTFGSLTFGALTLGALTLGALTFGALTLGALTLEALTLGALTFGALTFGTLTFGALTFGALTLGELTFGALIFGVLTLGALNMVTISHALKNQFNY